MCQRRQGGARARALLDRRWPSRRSGAGAKSTYEQKQIVATNRYGHSRGRTDNTVQVIQDNLENQRPFSLPA
jgi:hypothetical protein